jgi:hypothetical protein
LAALHWDAQSLTMTLYAVRKIEKGEEITISYIDPLHTMAERQRILRHKYGYSCSCPKCTLESVPRTVSDGNRTKLRSWLSDPHRYTFQRLLDETEGTTGRKKLQAYYKELSEYLKILKAENLQVLRSAWMEVTDMIACIVLAKGDSSSKAKLEIAKEIWRVGETLSPGASAKIALYDSWIEKPESAPFYALRSQ